jgi:hypothetical protein
VPHGDTKMLERYVCGYGKYYVMTFVWPAKDPQPKLGLEIMDSFRLIK